MDTITNQPLHMTLADMTADAIITDFPGLLRAELETQGLTVADATHAEAAVGVVLARVGIVQAQPMRRRPSTDATRARQSRGRRARLAQERQEQSRHDGPLPMTQASSDDAGSDAGKLAA